MGQGDLSIVKHVKTMKVWAAKRLKAGYRGRVWAVVNNEKSQQTHYTTCVEYWRQKALNTDNLLYIEVCVGVGVCARLNVISLCVCDKRWSRSCNLMTQPLMCVSAAKCISNHAHVSWRLNGRCDSHRQPSSLSSTGVVSTSMYCRRWISEFDSLTCNDNANMPMRAD